MTDEEKKLKREQYQAAVMAQRKEMQQAMEAVASTDSGKKVLRFIHNICGYDQNNLVINAGTGKVDTIATTYNECRRGVYLQLRALLPTEVLRQIEYPEIKEEKK